MRRRRGPRSPRRQTSTDGPVRLLQPKATDGWWGCSSQRCWTVGESRRPTTSTGRSARRWGGTLPMLRQLVGGYLPTDRALVRLRIGQDRATRPTGSLSTSAARPVHNDLHVRRRCHELLPDVLVPSRVATDGDYSYA